MTDRLLLRGGSVLDGTGAPARAADVLIEGDRVARLGRIEDEVDAPVLDVRGLSVAPGFINVLSHAWASIQHDPTAGSDVRQGVTTEVFGEAFSLGPADGRLREAMRPWADLADADARVEFPRLSEGLTYLQSHGVAVNVASFLGGVNLRLLAAGFDAGPVDATALDRVRGLVAEEMQEGALGIGTALIYAPGSFAGTDELIALAEVVGRHGGTYISHLRSEGDRFLECLEELLLIGERASCRVEAYHLKAAGQQNWPKMKAAIDVIETARQAGRPVAANMYPYTAGGTALAASIPPRFHVGGPGALLDRLADPAARAQMVTEMSQPSAGFENLFLGAGSGAGMLFFTDLPDGTRARGRRLTEVAADLGLPPAEALLELVARAPGVGAAYFLMDEDNIRLGLSQPWVSIGSDAAAHRAIPPYTESATHPRTYGTFARVLGHYCRDERLLTLPEAVRRMTSLPADNLGLAGRGRLQPGTYADVVVFDPQEVRDLATYADPHREAVGVQHVLVNGQLVLRDREFTGATPGRRLRRGVG